MPFSFLKYIQPTHYFRLTNKSGFTVFPYPQALPVDVFKSLEQDSGYESKEASYYDLSWQAIQSGYIGEAKCYVEFQKLSVKDNYHFIRKNFHPFWILYVLLIRVITLHNPIVELSSFFYTRSIKRCHYAKQSVAHKGYKNFQSPLLKRQPLVTVVIPTLNRYDYLYHVLKDLEAQDYSNFEVIVVDQSVPFKADFYNSFELDIRIVRQSEKALWLARNTAIKESKADYILLFDDDSRVEASWIREHLKCIDYFKAELSSGVSISLTGAKVPTNYSFFRISDQLDTGNVLICKKVFNSIGLFDRQFEKQRMGDAEFGLRAYLAGFSNISNPYAKRLHLKVSTGGLREMGSWDAFRPSNVFSPRPIPSVLYFFRRYFGNKNALYALFRNIPFSVMPYQFKKSNSLMLFGLLLSLVISPFIIIQVIRSWSLASIKLKGGPKIETLSHA